MNHLQERFFKPLCEHRYIERTYHRFCFLQAVAYAVDECVQRVLPTHMRRLTIRTKQPISGFEPSNISERSGKPVCPFAFFSSIARNAFSDLNRLNSKAAREHGKFLADAYTLLRHAPAMGDNIGLLSALAGDTYDPNDDVEMYGGYTRKEYVEEQGHTEEQWLRWRYEWSAYADKLQIEFEDETTDG